MQLGSHHTVVLTGAASGIGRATAEQLSKLGCRLALADWNSDALAQLKSDLGRDDGEVMTAAFDISDRTACEDFAADVVAQLGEVDVVINNAGVSQAQRVDALSYDDLNWIMDINFYGMVHGCKAFLPVLLARSSEQQRTKLVFVSSVFGIVGIPTQAAYNASKFAIRGFAEALREEVEPQGIDILVVCPGGIKTNLIRNGRIKDASAFGRSNEDPAERFERLAKTTPEQAAEQIIGAIARDKNRLLIGSDAKLLDRMQRLFPATYHRKLRRLMKLVR